MNSFLSHNGTSLTGVVDITAHSLSTFQDEYEAKHILFSHEPSLARHMKSVVQILILILAHRRMAQWLPCTI